MDSSGASTSAGTSTVRQRRSSKENETLATRSVRALTLDSGQSDPGWAAMDVRLRFTLLDSFLSLFIFTPLVIVYWFGTYGLLEVIAKLWLPPEYSAYALLLVGIYVEAVVCFLQQDFADRLPSSSSYYSHYFITRFFNFFLSVANIAHYRGLELLYQEHINVNYDVALQTAVTVTVLLWTIRCGRNIIGPPLCLEVDTEVENVFQASTRFKTTPGRSLGHLLDSVTSVAIVTTLVHIHWISVISVFDYIIYPDNLGWCILASSAIGYAIVYLFILLQGPARRISSFLEKYGLFPKIIFEDSYFVGANIGVVIVWKGLGQFFEALAGSFPVYHQGLNVTWVYALLGSFILLTMAHTSGTLVTKGCDVDGDFQDGAGINFPISYFGGFFAEEIEAEVKRRENKDINRNNTKKTR